MPHVARNSKCVKGRTRSRRDLIPKMDNDEFCRQFEMASVLVAITTPASPIDNK